MRDVKKGLVSLNKHKQKLNPSEPIKEIIVIVTKPGFNKRR